MKKAQIKQIITEEIKRQRKRLFFEGQNPMEPNAPAQPSQQQAAPAPVEPANAAPALDPKKAQGIVAGAIKTLMQSGALQGVGPEQVAQITADVVANIQSSVGGAPAAPTTASPAPIAAPEVDASEQDDPEFDDQVAHDSEANELDDQNQYDPDLDKQLSGGEEEEEPAPKEEPMFEVKQLKEALGMTKKVRLK